ncbi:MAG: Maf family nucleotide pyrophosphatase [Aquisalinus sp.]|nr:Maf family nucleotide pyrophosphatase [Aquisalinus sp.]
MNTPLILASKSPARRSLLQNTGISFQAIDSGLNEDLIKEEMRGEPPLKIAMKLAQEKALLVNRSNLNSLVIGADQILGFQGNSYDKPKNLLEAHDRLKEFSGKPHFLHTSICVAQNGEIIWSHTEEPILTMRDLDDQSIDAYLMRVGSGVLNSVGAYQLENIGIQLFSKIEGDYFSILGLPLVPLLEFLSGKHVTGSLI